MYYCWLLQGDRTLNIGDTALFQAGNAPPFIQILRKVTVEKEDRLKYKVMAPPSRASGYYCELCDRALVLGANLEEHKVGAIHRGLMEASGKMTRCQLQVFREELKVGRRKQKLSAKRAILEALRELVEPSNWCVPFFFSIVFYRGFFSFYRAFFYFLSFLFLFCLLLHDWVCDQKLYQPTFSPSRVGTRA
jgi:hypothetical protein